MRTRPGRVDGQRRLRERESLSLSVDQLVVGGYMEAEMRRTACVLVWEAFLGGQERVAECGAIPSSTFKFYR